jgi:hypothetical protein
MYNCITSDMTNHTSKNSPAVLKADVTRKTRMRESIIPLSLCRRFKTATCYTFEFILSLFDMEDSTNGGSASHKTLEITRIVP